VVCSGHGSCDNQGACTCEPGFRGTACEFMCPKGGSHMNITCSDNHDSCSNTGKCMCKDAKETQLNFREAPVKIVYPYPIKEGVLDLLEDPLGPTPMYVNDNCNVTCPVDAKGHYCSGHGVCTPKGTCQCNFGYQGVECQVPILRNEGCKVCVNGTFCCNGGECNRDKIRATGFGCDCAHGFRGIGCEVSCPLVPANGTEQVCNGADNGRCDKFGKCVCENHARGSECQFLCPRSNGYSGPVCSGRGDPNMLGNGCDLDGVCHCLPGYRLNACQKVCPRGLNPASGQNETCSGHGTCDSVGNCICDHSYRGKACQMQCPVKLQPPEKPAICYDSGTCDENAKCHCYRGFMGSKCDVACERCAISGKLCCFGRCHYDGRCICNTVDGVRYVGSTCELKWYQQKPSFKGNHTMATEDKYILMDGTGVSHGICMEKMRLNGPYQAQAGYIWHNTSQRVLGGFTTKFQIQMGDRSLRCRTIRNNQGNTMFYSNCHDHGADGMAFVIRGISSPPVGHHGKDLGYSGINNSIAIEFDTWSNSDMEPKMGGAGHVSINTRGHLQNNASHKYSLAAAPLQKLRNSLVKTVIVTYTPQRFTLESVHEDVIDNDRLLASSPGHLLSTQNLWPFLSSKSVGKLEVFVDDLEVPLITIPLDLGKVIHSPDGMAMVGFTSGTAEYYQAHDILQWYFCEGLNCTGTAWMVNQTDNHDSFCKELPCPRGYPWQYYPANVATTELGSTT